MVPFHVSLHAYPPGNVPQQPANIDGRTLSQLVVSPQQLTSPLSTTFDDALTQLSTFPRMHIEPDGAFVWVSDATGTERWQLDGTLFDRGERLQYVEVKGSCTAPAFEQFTAVFRPPPTKLIVQFVRHAVYVTEDEFRRWQFR